MHITSHPNTRRVVLSSYRKKWSVQFTAEAAKLQQLLGHQCEGIDHIGSTAIPNMVAKPTIDILVTLKDIAEIDALAPLFEKHGYRCMGEYGIADRCLFWRRCSTTAPRHHNIIRTNVHFTLLIHTRLYRACWSPSKTICHFKCCA